MKVARHSGFPRGPLSGLIAGLAVLTLSGCMLADLGLHGRRDEPIVGRNITSLEYARQLLLHEGRLIVSIGGDDPGIAVVDTASDIIVEFYRIFDISSMLPWSIALYHDSLLYVGNGHAQLNVLNLSSRKVSEAPISGLSDPTYYPAYYGPGRTLFATSDRVFLLDHGGGLIQGISGDTRTYSASIGMGAALTGIAVQNGKMFVTRWASHHVLILDANTTGGGTRDSLDLEALTGDTTYMLRPALAVTHGSRLFVSYYRVRTDSSHTLDSAAVAVINLSTLALEKIIPLRFKGHLSPTDHPSVPRVVNGIWYLASYDYAGEPSGVERIDLNTAVYSGTPLTGLADGETVQDFLPTGAGIGYVVPRSSYMVKRVTY